MDLPLVAGVAVALLIACAHPLEAAGQTTLASHAVSATFSRDSGSLVRLRHRPTGQVLSVAGDEFTLVFTDATVEQGAAKLVSVRNRPGGILQATYEAAGLTVVARWSLGRGRSFLEKQLCIITSEPAELRHVVISRPAFTGVPLEFAPYEHLQTTTYFGRWDDGGVFAGVELVFDRSSVLSPTQVELGR